MKNQRMLWVLPSSRGWEHLIFSRRSGLLLDLRVQMNFWNRALHDFSSQLVPDVRVLLPQVKVSEESLDGFADCCRQWLETREGFAFEFTESAGDQSLIVSVGLRKDVICSNEKPVLTIAFKADYRIQTSLSFVIDQSCMQVFLDEAESRAVLPLD